MNYTLEQWGVKQMYDYESSIDSGFIAIKENPYIRLSKEVTGYNKPTRYLKIEKHKIYYTIENDVIVVLRILHEQMNPDLHL